jgi:hypothetical protein
MSKPAMSLFAKVEAEVAAASAPLAERMRPRALEEFAGQQALLGPGKPLRQNHPRAPDRAAYAFRIRFVQRGA